MVLDLWHSFSFDASTNGKPTSFEILNLHLLAPICFVFYYLMQLFNLITWEGIFST